MMSQVFSDQGGEQSSRRFGVERPSQAGLQVSVQHPRYPNQPFCLPPPPTGQPPYHLSLDQILPADLMQQIRASGRIVFHIAGDTGGVRSPQPQQIVAMHMEEQFNLPNPADRPAFFYHLGDVVYYYGEASEYYPQFYEPYAHYPAPILAIPGNHDGAVIDPAAPSLAAFVENFCSQTPHFSNQAGDVPRDTMTQPNAYWTLDAPFVTIIGLYTNVPEGGQIEDAQFAWLVSELSNAPREKALILAGHHAAYSADAHHSGSGYLKQIIDQAVSQSGRMPDAIFAGHIHNFQRFTRSFEGWEVPYIVAGAGGYWHLHYMAKQPDGSVIQPPYAIPGSDVTLESFVEDRHGFMRLVVSPQAVIGEYFTVSRPQESWRAPATRADVFTLDLNQHRLVR